MIYSQVTTERKSKVSPIEPAERAHGVVYTKSWVVNLILDLGGYTDDKDLSQLVLVEPSAGTGSFLVEVVRRLIDSCQRYDRSVEACAGSIIAYELDAVAADICRSKILAVLCEKGVDEGVAQRVAAGWVTTGDYLLDQPKLARADVIVGNPPYIRLEDLDSTLTGIYRQKYPTMIGRSDLYVAFFEAALRQLKLDGTCVFICADRWMLNQYGARLRSFITAQFAVEAVMEMHTVDAFDAEVSAYPAITKFSRRRQGNAVVARAEPGIELASVDRMHYALMNGTSVSLGGNSRPVLQASGVDSWFKGESPWPSSSPERLALLRRLESNFYPLQSIGTGTRVSIGVATGADDLFITENADLVEFDRLLPLAMAKDLGTGEVAWSGKYLVNPWDGRSLANLSQFPRLASYFESHEGRLKSRHVGKKSEATWYRTIDKVDPGLSSRSKLYVADIKDRLRPVLDRGETYPHHNLYFVESPIWDLEVLGGILLSDVAQFFIESYAVKMRGGYLRFQAQYLRRIRTPLPHEISEADQLALKTAFRERDLKAANVAAFRLYGIDGIPALGGTE